MCTYAYTYVYALVRTNKHLHVLVLGVDPLGELGEGVLRLEYEVVNVVLVVEAVQHVQDGGTQLVREGLQTGIDGWMNG